MRHQRARPLAPAAMPYVPPMGMPRLSGKVVLITGAAGGIGAAAARAMTAEGAVLLLTDADAAGAEQVAQEIGESTTARGHDVTSEDDWQAVTDWSLQTHGRV